MPCTPSSCSASFTSSSLKGLMTASTFFIDRLFGLKSGNANVASGCWKPRQPAQTIGGSQARLRAIMAYDRCSTRPAVYLCAHRCIFKQTPNPDRLAFSVADFGAITASRVACLGQTAAASRFMVPNRQPAMIAVSAGTGTPDQDCGETFSRFAYPWGEPYGACRFTELSPNLATLSLMWRRLNHRDALTHEAKRRPWRLTSQTESWCGT